jgi:pyruvate dehydrogenase E2 component (dihydrolipoamide acetyltransferase)
LPEGLTVPVVRNVAALPLAEVGARIRELAARARANGLRAPDLADGTCTITNLGASGVDAFTPILNPPQSCILGIGRIRPRAVPRDGAIVIAQTCVLSLTFDHRVCDGAPAAQVLDVIARRMIDEAWLAELAKET